MSDTRRFHPAGTSTARQDLDATQATGRGRIEFDELGNAVWVPMGGLGSEEVLARLLNDETLSLSHDERPGTVHRVQPNPTGLGKGYDPYDSGMLVKRQWKPKKDLRALSKWIEQKNRVKGED